MTRPSDLKEVMAASRFEAPKRLKPVGIGLSIAGLIGLLLGFLGSGDKGSGWSALLTASVLIIGMAMVGPLLSAIFQLTGAKWGRAYRRLAEGSVVLMPIGLVALIVLVIGGGQYLPWVHEHPHLGGKAVWLTRGFWDARVLIALLGAYAVGLAFVRLSWRRDFCLSEVRSGFGTLLSNIIKRGISDPEKEAARISRKMGVLAPIVIIVYAVSLSLLAFDLIMALEPEWFSTLFGAWYFVGTAFAGLALLAIGSLFVARSPGMGRFFTKNRQSDLATLMLAFSLINADFFWNQYLTIWYANLPEETFYLIERTVDEAGPWRPLSFVSLIAFFFIPFVALLFRKVKRTAPLLTAVSITVVVGVFLARFIEIGPCLLDENTGIGALSVPLVSAVLIFLGFLGGGLLLLVKWFQSVPLFAVNDPIFVDEIAGEEGAK